MRYDIFENSDMPSKPPTPAEFRLACGQFATGVTVVTAERVPGKVHGMTANSVTSVSLNPLLLLVCVDHRAHLLPLLKEKKQFGVNVLKQEQQSASRYFAQTEENEETEAKLGIRYRWTESGIPCWKIRSSTTRPKSPQRTSQAITRFSLVRWKARKSSTANRSCIFVAVIAELVPEVRNCKIEIGNSIARSRVKFHFRRSISPTRDTLTSTSVPISSFDFLISVFKFQFRQWWPPIGSRFWP